MLEMIRERPEFDHVPVVALTASVMNEEVQQLKRAGFNGVIAKPIDVDTFPDILQRILDGETVWRIVS
jgi:CheY-like chemotaxis protein